jgi:hypothetical protein
MKKQSPPKPPHAKNPAPPKSRNPLAQNRTLTQQARRVLGKHYRAKFGVK